MCVCVCLQSAESSKQYQEYQLVPNWLQTAAGWSESEGTYLWLPGSGETRVCAARAGVRPGLYKVPGPSSRQPRSSRELDRVGRCDNTCGPGHQHQVSHKIHQGCDQGDDHCLFLWPTCSRKTVALMYADFYEKKPGSSPCAYPCFIMYPCVCSVWYQHLTTPPNCHP